jgi:hypothetical protein
MNPYAMIGSRAGTSAAATLSLRLAAWHDSMVAHERLLRAKRAADVCHDECPHVEARALWSEAQETFGPRADELVFLRSRAMSARSDGRPDRTDSGRASAGSVRRAPGDSRDRSSNAPRAVGTTAEV